MRGWLTALDAASGTVAWRAYHTGPDKDVLIGPEFKPFYEQDRGKDLGVHTWPSVGWGLAMADLKKDTQKGGTLYVFTVEGK